YGDAQARHRATAPEARAGQARQAAREAGEEKRRGVGRLRRNQQAAKYKLQRNSKFPIGKTPLSRNSWTLSLETSLWLADCGLSDHRPSPLPSPEGRGRNCASVFRSWRAPVLSNDGMTFPLSLRERAGVRVCDLIKSGGVEV